MRSGIILVGGEARRAGGREKYFFRYCGQTFIERIIDVLQGVVDEIIIVARDPGQCTRLSAIENVKITHDLRKGLGPIGGIHAGVNVAQGDEIFVVAGDMPCVNPEVVEFLFSLIDGHDTVIPAWDAKMLEPLHSVYKKEAVAGYLSSHESLSLQRMVRELDSRYVDVNELRHIDPLLKTFTNVNKLEDLDTINNCISQESEAFQE